MFSRVCGFRVRVRDTYRTSRIFAYECGSVTELTKVPDIVARAYKTHRTYERVQNMLYPYPGYCGTGRTEPTELPGADPFESLPDVPGVVARAYRTYRSSGQV